MELPFYLLCPESPGASWDGLVSLHGDDLHFELRGGGDGERTQFDVPLNEVAGAEFQRGLVSRKLRLTVGSEKHRQYFPAGVTGEEVHLMVARDDLEFGPPEAHTEVDFERLVGEIEERSGASPVRAQEGLAS